MDAKKWCEHIKVSGRYNQAVWVFHPINEFDLDDQITSASCDWNFCPICGAVRP